MSEANPIAGGVTTSFREGDKEGFHSGKTTIPDLCATKSSCQKATILYLPETSTAIHQEDIARLSDLLRIPRIFWTPLADEASSFYGCQENRGPREELESFGTCLPNLRHYDSELCADELDSYFRFLIKEPLRSTSLYEKSCPNITSYIWHKLGFYVAWTPTNGALVICRGLSQSLQSLLSQELHIINEETLFNDPFAFHIIVLERLTAFYDAVLWSWRDEIRHLEQNRPLSNNPQPDFTKIHDIARHAIHSTETLAIAIQTIEGLIQEHEIFATENPTLSQALSQLPHTGKRFRSHLSVMKCLHLRSKALEDRLRNETNLAFNIVAQYNSQVSVKIGDATRADSAVTKTIAVLGMGFLPGTFICAIFSTSFFNFSPGMAGESQRWVVSEKFWVYWVVAVPVTALTMAFWKFSLRDGKRVAA